MEIIWSVISWEGEVQNVEKVQGLRSIMGRYLQTQNIKNSIGNREAKELTCTNHGHEPSDGIAERKGGTGGTKGGKVGEL